jgi:hypothetical protein
MVFSPTNKEFIKAAKQWTADRMNSTTKRDAAENIGGLKRHEDSNRYKCICI